MIVDTDDALEFAEELTDLARAVCYCSRKHGPQTMVDDVHTWDEWDYVVRRMLEIDPTLGGKVSTHSK